MRSLIAAAVLGLGLAGAASAAPSPDLDHGKRLYQYWCATCHGAGTGNFPAPNLPGTQALAFKYKGEKPALIEERTDLPAATVSYFVRNGVSVMPFFRKTEISDEELADLAAYVARNTR